MKKSPVDPPIVPSAPSRLECSRPRKNCANNLPRYGRRTGRIARENRMDTRPVRESVEQPGDRGRLSPGNVNDTLADMSGRVVDAQVGSARFVARTEPCISEFFEGIKCAAGARLHDGRSLKAIAGTVDVAQAQAARRPCRRSQQAAVTAVARVDGSVDCRDGPLPRHVGG